VNHVIRRAGMARYSDCFVFGHFLEDFGDLASMDRRRFSRIATFTPAALAVASALPGVALAQGKAPEKDFDYRVLNNPQRTDAPGKVEVIEFFWYGCPHCFAFEPHLEPWVKKVPAHVSFKRVPAIFNDNWHLHAKLFYTLEGMKELDRLHGKVFTTIHVDKKGLSTDIEIAEWAAANGIDRKKFTEMFKSFGVQGKADRARQLTDGYRIDGVPAMAVNGKFVTANTMVGSHAAVLPVVDFLVEQERKK
jgi:protein dithiol oxidoreductase (disulfide-forming)